MTVISSVAIDDPRIKWNFVQAPATIDIEDEKRRRVAFGFMPGDMVEVDARHKEKLPALADTALQVEAVSITLMKTGYYKIDLQLTGIQGVFEEKYFCKAGLMLQNYGTCIEYEGDIWFQPMLQCGDPKGSPIKVSDNIHRSANYQIGVTDAKGLKGSTGEFCFHCHDGEWILDAVPWWSEAMKPEIDNAEYAIGEFLEKQKVAMSP